MGDTLEMVDLLHWVLSRKNFSFILVPPDCLSYAGCVTGVVMVNYEISERFKDALPTLSPPPPATQYRVKTGGRLSGFKRQMDSYCPLTSVYPST